MSDKTIYLQASTEERMDIPKAALKSLRICICDDQQEPIKSYQVNVFNKKNVYRKCLEINEILDISSKKGESVELYEQLKMKGSSLCDDLLTPEQKKELRVSDAEFLIIDIDDHLVHIPWELLYIDDFFLCERFAIGRNVKTRQSIVKSEKRKLSFPLKMLIVANPNNDLQNAASEGLAIFKHMNRSQSKGRNIEAILESHMTLERIKDQIRNYDIVHFAGHATYDCDYPGRSGWQLSKNNFTANTIKNMAGSKALPVIVFSNACQSARTDEWDIENLPANSAFGLANAFMLAGTRHYIGTFGKIPDPTGGKFAQLFYEQLNTSKTIGQALRDARLMLKNENSCIWANYLMYGDPRETYITGNTSTLRNNENIKNEVKAPHGDHSKLRAESIQDQASIQSDINPEEIKATQKTKIKFRTNLIFILLLLPILFGIKYSIIDNSENTVKDEWTSKPVTMAVVFISKDNSLNNEKANILSQSIMMELKSYNRFILLERIDLDIVKSELDLWMSKYTTSEKKMKPDLLQAELLLKIDLTGPDSQNTAHLSNIFISLINAQTGDIKELLNVKLEPGSIIAQRKRISRQLIERLKEEYPRRGIITTVNKQQIMMNIGSNVGVKIGQQYNTLLNQKIILSVESVDLDFSWLKIDPKNKTLFQKGLKINEARFSNFIPANNHSTKKDPLLLIVNRTD
jgi:CHAT domain-containing protein